MSEDDRVLCGQTQAALVERLCLGETVSVVERDTRRAIAAVISDLGRSLKKSEPDTR